MAQPVWVNECKLTRKEIDRMSRDSYPDKREVISPDMIAARRNLHKALHVRMDSKWKAEELGDRVLASDNLGSAKKLLERELATRDAELADPSTDRSQDYVQPPGWGSRGFNGEFAKRKADQKEDNMSTATKEKTTKAKPATKGKAKPAAKKDAPAPRQSKYAGKTIKMSKTVIDNKKENPRRAGTFGFKSMQIIIDAGARGLKFETFIEKGGRAKDLTWDIEKGNAVAE